MRDIHRRYYRRFTPAMIAYVAVMLLVWPLFRVVQAPWLKVVIALLPMLPTVFVVRAMVRLVMESDEFEQRIHLVALGVASTVVGVTSLAVGFLASAHLVAIDGDALIWIFPSLIFSYGVARNWANRRYGIDASDESGAGLRFLWFMIGAFVVLFVVLLPWIDKEQEVALATLVGALATFALVMTLRRRLVRRRKAIPE